MQNDLDSLLNEAKELLKKEIPTISFDTWIKVLNIDSMQDNNIVLTLDDPFKIDIVKNRYGSLINNTFNYILNKNCTVSFVLLTSEKTSSVSNQPITDLHLGYSNSSLNPKYTFDNFVVGGNNEFAHAAALAVAEAPATAYNPLFLYGGVGLGKTHLMYAIGNEVKKHNPNMNVMYVTSEKFTNEFINAIKDNKNEEFRNKYRNIDILLIDDIQFIAGKERIQEEFFHTFNSLRESGKQIIISSDRPPRDIPLLEERLKTRFGWGVIADISMPDYETRLAILKKKTDESNIIISNDILSNIATKIDSNIRELEGVFTKLVATSTLTHAQITMEMSEKAINDIIRQKENVISIDYIQEVVSKYFNVSVEDLKSSKRSNDVAFPRQIAMYLCRNIIYESFPNIGKAFGNRDHSTVMHAYNKIEEDIKNNSQTKLIVDSVKNIVMNKND